MSDLLEATNRPDTQRWGRMSNQHNQQLPSDLVRVLYAIARSALDGCASEEIIVATARSLQQLAPFARTISIILGRDDNAIAVSLRETEATVTRGDAATRHPIWLCEWFHMDQEKIVADLRLIPDTPESLLALALHGERVLLAAPIFASDRQIGVIVLTANAHKLFTAEHTFIAREIARQLSSAIERSEMYRTDVEQRKRLRDLTAQMAAFEETERQQLARELHDRIGQNLTALGINLNIIRSLLPPHSSSRMADRLDYAMKLVEETVGHVRDVMAGLRPAVLDDYGLLAALRWYGERFAYYTGVNAVVSGTQPEPRPSQAIEMTLFRIAQEALTNVAKHAMAGKATVMLEDSPNELRMTVADDGIGFDALAPHNSGDQCWGLITMRERADGVRGRLHITSRPGAGTQILVTVPKS